MVKKKQARRNKARNRSNNSHRSRVTVAASTSESVIEDDAQPAASTDALNNAFSELEVDETIPSYIPCGTPIKDLQDDIAQLVVAAERQSGAGHMLDILLGKEQTEDYLKTYYFGSFVVYIAFVMKLSLRMIVAFDKPDLLLHVVQKVWEMAAAKGKELCEKNMPIDAIETWNTRLADIRLCWHAVMDSADSTDAILRGAFSVLSVQNSPKISLCPVKQISISVPLTCSICFFRIATSESARVCGNPSCKKLYCHKCSLSLTSVCHYCRRSCQKGGVVFTLQS